MYVATIDRPSPEPPPPEAPESTNEYVPAVKVAVPTVPVYEYDGISPTSTL